MKQNIVYASSLFLIVFIFGFKITNAQVKGIIAPIPNTAPPVFVIQPKSQSVNKGSTVKLEASVDTLGFAYFQWQFNGVDIKNNGFTASRDPLFSTVKDHEYIATSTYIINNFKESDVGKYSVRVGNLYHDSFVLSHSLFKSKDAYLTLKSNNALPSPSPSPVSLQQIRSRFQGR